MKVVNVKNVAIGEGMTKICVPLVAPTDYDVDYQLRIIAKSEPDMVEFRADMYEKCFDREALMKTLAKILRSWGSSLLYLHSEQRARVAAWRQHSASITTFLLTL